jgi:hypothetical protein
MWYNQRNMHVHYSNTVINILRITETHMSICDRPRMGVRSGPPDRRPREFHPYILFQ